MLSVTSIIGLALLVVLIVVALIFLKSNKNKKLTKEEPVSKNAIEKKEGPAEAKPINPNARSRSTTKTDGGSARSSTKSTVNYGKIDPLNDEVSQFQTASTVLSNTCLADEDKERGYFEKMLSVFHKIFENTNAEDIKNFCKQFKISSVKRGERGANMGVNLEIDENQACMDSNLWLISYKNSAQHRIVPGTIIRTSFKTLNAENARSIGEIFRGIMLIVPGNTFEVVEPAIAEKRNDMLVITKIGKLGVPMGSGKR